MAISEDLRSVQAILGGMLGNSTAPGNAGFYAAREAGGAHIVRLLCDNLSALADQVEALEAVPLAPVSTALGVMGPTCFLSRLPRSCSMDAPVQ